MTSERENSHGLPRVPSIPLSDDTSAGADQSIGALVKDATTHLSTLIRGELELAKTEIAGEVKKGLFGSVYLIVALVLVLLALPFVLVTAALGINKGLWSWADPWGGFAIITILMFVAAGFFGLKGKKKLTRLQAPQRTIDSAKDTVAALSRRNGDEPDRLEPGRP